MEESRLAPASLEQFRRLSTCVVASAIETFKVRLPNTGFANSRIRCVFKNFPPVAGYAATARIRTANPPMEGRSYSYDRTDWWDHILAIPAPRIVVIEDLDDPPGLGAFIGEVNANILLALGCVGLVTNGAVRDLSDLESRGFQMFAGNVAVSHAYAHISDFGGPAMVGDLEIHPGDLIHGDRHGVQKVPLDIAAKIPPVAHEIIQRRQHVIGLCCSAERSLDDLRSAVKESDSKS
jgi:4-hydroxy-4-methyl-2-oxoglutarate aldolase